MKYIFKTENMTIVCFSEAERDWITLNLEAKGKTYKIVTESIQKRLK